MEECHHSDYNIGGFLGRPINHVFRNHNSPFVPSDMMASPQLILSSSTTRNANSKRKHELVSNYYQPSYVESCLVQLCRGQRWMEAVNRCQIYPEEACLVPIHRNDSSFYRYPTKQASFRSVCGQDNNNSETLFRETALGIVCASKFIGTEEGKQVVLALLHVNPNQVWASQCIPGHTPFREAILNSCCTVEIFRILAETAFNFSDGKSIYRKDQNGHMPIDHLLMSVQLGSSQDSLSMLREFLRMTKSEKIPSSLKDHTSPLIRLLTLGNGFNVSTSPMKARKSFRANQRKKLENETLRLQRVLHATKILLDNDPDLLFQGSKVTQCNPLHVALRNYGNFSPLIEELLRRDSANKMVQTRNCYGDLPIHVACSVGVSFNILALIIEKTASITPSYSSAKEIRDMSNCGKHPLIWSCNKSGYRAVDLEWICHIEAGHGLYTARHFCPSDPTVMKRHCLKQDTYYRDLLKMSVNQVTSRKEEADIVFGCLLDRISLLIRATSFTIETKSSLGKAISSSKLGTPYSASLPLPMLELFLWLRPEEVMERDPQGYLPIHHALRYGLYTFGHCNSSNTSMSLNAIEDWKSFIFQLLDKTPEQCKTKCQNGRLPLHYALDYSSKNRGGETSHSDTSSTVAKVLRLSRHAIIERLIDLYPGSVDQKDPVTGLYPFMMASSDESIPLNTAFFILRRSPSRCLSVEKTKKN